MLDFALVSGAAVALRVLAWGMLLLSSLCAGAAAQ